MKRLLSVIVFLTAVIPSLQAQPVSDYSYKLDNGIVVKMEHCWNQVWVQQAYSPLNTADKTPLSVSIVALGDIKSSASFKLLNSGKEVKLLGAAPGSYDLRLTFKLSGKSGTLGFIVKNILLKPATKTTVNITLYDYQILIDETAASGSGLASYESNVNRCKTNLVQDLYFSIPTFYEKGKHETAIAPDQSASKTKGKIKPGTYDVLFTIGISGQSHKVWLENFQFKPDINYKVSINLNAGGISYTGGNKDVKAMQLYPAGTSAKQTGTPAPVKNQEIIRYENPTLANCCSPGTYDVLLNFGNGTKYEWRKNIAVNTGSKTDIK
jgi:hypothetical protein